MNAAHPIDLDIEPAPRRQVRLGARCDGLRSAWRLLMLAVLGAPAVSAGQDAETLTLMQALAGATYERRVYDDVGSLSERQRLSVGVPSQDAGLHSGLDSGLYSISSEIRVRTRVLGIPVRTARFRSEEWVTPGVGLVRHRLVADDGGVSVAERVDSAAPGKREVR